MPLVPTDISNINFSQKDLFLDVQLETITIKKGFVDFTGKSSFKTKFFRESIGFGITNIKISTNASLQPTVDIEFKDLYGKTVFAESSQDDLDYKGLFQWPPPKFKFTFKGYLGNPVTWMLNMKTTSTQFNADDGSYSIKATFIPNQWGMFADMPFLYLFATKKLKANNVSPINNSSTQQEIEKFQKETESILDLMYVGKKINVLKKKKTKDFEKITNSLTLLKRDPITGLLGGTFKNKDELTEITPENDSSITGFSAITINLPSNYSNLSETEVKDRIRGLSYSTNRVVENIRIKLAILKGLGKTEGNELEGFKSTESDEQVIDSKKNASKKLDGIIDENLRLIDEAVKGKLFDENEEELKKLTIKEVFSRIAGDAAYILGYMLDSGEQGYFNNKTIREKAESNADIIGLYFPMKWEEKEDGESVENSLKSQVPAKGDYGIENFELKFVNEFIVAISQGIAQNRALQAQSFDIDEDKIKHRVSNLEIISSNPFRNIIDWKEIASIIMKRAAVAGYILQGSLVNAPGDYGSWVSRNYTPDNMRKLAGGDTTNIDDSILTKLQPEDLENLKEFCTFWLELLDTDGITTKSGKKFGDDFLFETKVNPGDVNKFLVITSKGNESSTEDAQAKSIIRAASGDTQIVNSSILQVLGDSTNNTITISSELSNAGFKAYTVEQYLEQFIGPRYLFHGRSTRQALENVKPSKPTLQSTFSFYDTLSYVVNFNNLTFIHHPEVEDDYYEFLVFEDAQDIQKLREFQPGSNEGDVELTKSGANEGEEPEPLENYPQTLIFIDDIEYTPDSSNPSTKTDTPGYEWYQKAKSGNIEKINGDSFIRYNWCKSRNSLNNVVSNVTKSSDPLFKDVGGETPVQVAPTLLNIQGDYRGHFNLTDEGPSERTEELEGFASRTVINVTKKPIAIVPYGQNWNSKTTSDFALETAANIGGVVLNAVTFGLTGNGNADVGGGKQCPTGGFFGTSELAKATRVFLREFCRGLYTKIESLQDETSKIFGQILGKAGEHEDLLYQQMHNLFHQWQILALNDENSRINTQENPKKLTPNVAIELEEKFSKSEETNSFDNSSDRATDEGDYSSGFIYSYPLQSRGENKKFIKISDSLINIDPLYSAKANTTVLNVLQQLCSKNNFLFFPIAGNSGFLDIDSLFQPSITRNGARISNSFQILFHPTPESRALVGNDEPIASKFKTELEDFAVKAFPVAFGDPTNKIIKSVVVGTDDNKVTAESIVNLQRIVDNENKNRTVTTDCSLLSVFEGRSYKASLSTLGNAQISPMQFFYLQNHAIFSGLYQIMKVDHSISPNDMTTDFEGIKMRYAAGDYGGVLPITLQNYRDASRILKNSPREIETVFGGFFQDAAALPPSDGSIEGGNIISQGAPVSIDGLEFVDFGPSGYLNEMYNDKDKPGPTSSFREGSVDTIVIHWTAGWTLDGAVRTLKKRGVHYHMLIHENGTLYKVSNLQKKAWHAGAATNDGARGTINLNSSSIGISFAGGIVKIGGEIKGYEKTIQEWNSEEFKATGNDRVTYNPKKQFAGIIQACILAKREHPNIKFITGHHWTTTRKTDPGDSFPWEILLKKLREADSSFNNVEIKYQMPNNNGKGGVVRPNASPKKLKGDIDVNINLS